MAVVMSSNLARTPRKNIYISGLNNNRYYQCYTAPHTQKKDSMKLPLCEPFGNSGEFVCCLVTWLDKVTVERHYFGFEACVDVTLFVPLCGFQVSFNSEHLLTVIFLNQDDIFAIVSHLVISHLLLSCYYQP